MTTTECLPPWTGDARGTWGGYFDWEPDIIDTATNWSAVLFLVGQNSAFNPVEACPDAERVVDVAIRRPQQFKPSAGSIVSWELREPSSNTLLQSGTNVVGPDELVSVFALAVPRGPVRARLTVALPGNCLPCPVPVLTVRRLTNGLVELNWPGCPSMVYQLQRSVALQDWEPVDASETTPSANGTMT